MYDEQPTTTYRLEYETTIEQRKVVSYRPVWETSTRERRYTVSKPIAETGYREEYQTVMRPIVEVRTRDASYNRVSYVTETQSRVERRVVNRPVVETSSREESRVVYRPVSQTVYQDQAYTTYQPVTTYRPQVVDQGGYADAVTVKESSRNRLRWLSAVCDRSGYGAIHSTAGWILLGAHTSPRRGLQGLRTQSRDAVCPRNIVRTATGRAEGTCGGYLDAG